MRVLLPREEYRGRAGRNRLTREFFNVVFQESGHGSLLTDRTRTAPQKRENTRHMPPAVGNLTVNGSRLHERRELTTLLQPVRRSCVFIEDHRMFADLLSMQIAASPDLDLEIVETSSSVTSGIAACDRHQPDLLLLNPDLKDGPAVAVAEHLATSLPAARVVVVAGRASGFVCPPHLADRIDGVVGQADAYRSLQLILARLFPPVPPAGTTVFSAKIHRPIEILSRREREIFSLIGQRFSSREIAERIGVSLHTVNAHRKNIARKLRISGKKLAFLAYEYQLLKARGRAD